MGMSSVEKTMHSKNRCKNIFFPNRMEMLMEIIKLLENSMRAITALTTPLALQVAPMSNK